MIVLIIFQSKNQAVALCSYDLNADGIPELITGWSNGKVRYSASVVTTLKAHLDQTRFGKVTRILDFQCCVTNGNTFPLFLNFRKPFSNLSYLTCMS